MSIEERVAKLEAQMRSLQSAYIQSQRNEIPIRGQIDELTPWTASKTAYIDDTEIAFDNVPTGNLTVFFDKDYEVDRIGDKVVISFEALTEVKEITIMIQ